MHIFFEAPGINPEVPLQARKPFIDSGITVQVSYLRFMRVPNPFHPNPKLTVQFIFIG